MKDIFTLFDRIFQPSFSTLVERVRPAVLKLTVSYGKVGTCSTAFHVGGGLLATCAHCLEDAARVSVEDSDAKTFRFLGVVATDKVNDLCLLRVDADNLPSLRLGDSTAVKVGDPVSSCGHPGRYGWTLSTGIIAARRNDDLQCELDLIGGQSGSPLLSRNGDVIGVLKTSKDDTSISFATPSARLVELIQRKGETPPAPLPPAVDEDAEVQRAFAFKSALEADKSGDFPMMLVHAVRLARDHPCSWRARALAGEAFARVGFSEEAVSHFVFVASDQPTSGAAWHRLGLAQLQASDCRGAITSLRQACACDFPGWATLCRAYRLAGRILEADALDKIWQTGHAAPGTPETTPAAKEKTT